MYERIRTLPITKIAVITILLLNGFIILFFALKNCEIPSSVKEVLSSITTIVLGAYFVKSSYEHTIDRKFKEEGKDNENK